MHDVFISYSHQDHTIATSVLAILESRGIKCWIDYRDANVGEEYSGSIVRAIRGAKFFVLLLSEKSGSSGHVLGEVNSAVKYGATVIPFKIDDAELSDNFEYYMGKTHWLEALTPPVEAHINRLADIIEHYKQSPEVSHSNTTSFNTAPAVSSANPVAKVGGCRVINYQEALELGYTARSIAIQLVENDYINYNGIGQENEGSAEQWEEFLANDSDTFHYFINEQNEIVGDWSIVSLDDEAYEQAINGELLEENLSGDNTNMLVFPGEYKGYIMTMSLLTAYRNMKNYNLLIDSFIRQIQEYAENGIFFTHWCMNVFSKEVLGMVKQMGFKFKCKNMVFGDIYELPFAPLPKIPLFKKYERLVELYDEQYGG